MKNTHAQPNGKGRRRLTPLVIGLLPMIFTAILIGIVSALLAMSLSGCGGGPGGDGTTGSTNTPVAANSATTTTGDSSPTPTPTPSVSPTGTPTPTPTPTPLPTNYVFDREVGGLNTPGHPADGSVIVPNAGSNNLMAFNATTLALDQTVNDTGLAINPNWSGAIASTTDVNGKIYVVDQNNDRVIRFNPGFTAPFLFTTCPGNNAMMDIEAKGNLVTILQLDSNSKGLVRRFQLDGTELTSWTDVGWANSPQSIAMDGNGRVYVSDTGNNRVTRYANNGQNAENFLTGLNQPVGIAANNNLFAVCNSGTFEVQVFDLSKNPIKQFGVQGNGSGQFQFPSGLTFVSGNNLGIVDAIRNVLQLWKAQ